jgi:hypothetical protein
MTVRMALRRTPRGPVLAALSIAVLSAARVVSAQVPGTGDAIAPEGAPSRTAQTQGQPPDALPAESQEALYAAPTRADRSGRILAAVEIEGRGPYRFILDTGANSSALAPRVAAQLQLPAAPDVAVHGVTGTAMLPAVKVHSMRAGDVVLPPTVLPVLPGDIFGDADGILGVSGMQEMRIDVDFMRDRVAILRSHGWRATSSYVTIRARLWQGGLLLVAGRVGSIPAQIIIDTGAERTMGNVPLRDALQARSRHGEEAATSVFGATTDVESGTYFRAPRISIGSTHLDDQVVTFGDLHVFELWGLTDKPALVIGMDVLGQLERFIVDYKRREFQIRARGGTGKAAIRKCTATTCGSRIPETGNH